MASLNEAFDLIYKKNKNIIDLPKCPKCSANNAFWDGINYYCVCGFGCAGDYIKEKYSIDIKQVIKTQKLS
jgi:hypothetical protein